MDLGDFTIELVSERREQTDDVVRSLFLWTIRSAMTAFRAHGFSGSKSWVADSTNWLTSLSK
jgi:hypothetical protein